MDAIETIDYRGYSIQVIPDDDAENPFEDGDYMPTLVLHDKAQRRFGWTSDKDWGRRLNEALGELNQRHPLPVCLAIIDRWMRIFHGTSAVFPVAVYEHSGTAVYIGQSAHFLDPGGWDSGWVGWFFATREQIEAWGTPAGLVDQSVVDSFDIFKAWVEGDCYWWRIFTPDGEDVESCSGYYGFDQFRNHDGYPISECKAIIDAHIAEHEDDPADPPHLTSWHPCKWQTHAGVIAPSWDTDPDGPTGWEGWCGIPTDDESGLCREHRAQLAVAR